MIPDGYFLNGWHSGIKKNGSKDFGFIFSDKPANAYAVFTKNKFIGNPILVGKEHIKKGILQCIIVNSGNSNVATGKKGLELAYSSCRWTGDALKISPDLVLPSSTGVIGRELEPETIRKACFSIPEKLAKEPENFSEAIMTTDQFPKIEMQQLENIKITGFAKGAGMIHPDMATMLAYVITDAMISSEDLKNLTQVLADLSFNRISVDSDTSTSDTFVIMANGKSKQKIKLPYKELQKLYSIHFEDFKKFIDSGFFNSSLDEILEILKKNLELDELSLRFFIQIYKVCFALAKKIVLDGEGTTKIFRVMVSNASERKIAKKIAQSLSTSPLVKTAVFGGDPNWGRFLMAIGKVEDNFNVDQIKILCNSLEVYPELKDLKVLEEEMKKREIMIDVQLNDGRYSDFYLGCDLNYNYVKLNSEYTT